MDSSLAHLMAWSERIKGDVPPPLTGPSINISPLPAPHPPTVFLFGGKLVQSRRLSSAMWALGLTTRTWTHIDAGEGPRPRYFHSMDIWEDKLVCFGGMSDSDPTSVHNDIWFFDCLSRRWLPPPSPGHPLEMTGTSIEQDPTLMPSARYAHISAVSRGKLVVSGGQHSDNSWIYEISVFDLKHKVWISKTEQPEKQGLHSKGAYRSVATSSKQRVIVPSKGGEFKTSSAHSYAIEEDGEGGDIWCYSNYDFAKVRRELDLISPISESSEPALPSDKHHSPPSFAIREQSCRIRGSSQPPGLRFPTGGVVGNHFILCGLYLATTSAAFSIWALDLDNMSWKYLEPAVLNTGSWNRAIVWPEQARILIFGNSQGDLADDYGRRTVNLDQMAVISLEVYGIYPPLKLEIPSGVQQVGLTMLDEKPASDFEVVCDDGRRIKCSRRLLSDRWPWFAELEKELAAKTAGALKDVQAVDINDTLLGAFTPARLTPSHLNIPEPFPVCVALVQYFYTLSLSTPLQNRAPVLSALLFHAKQYKIDRLARLIVHALHERLEPNNAVGVYEIATLSGEQNLQVRALNMIHSAKSGSSSRTHRQGPAGVLAGEGSRSGTPQKTNALKSASVESTGVFAPRSSEEGHYRRARAESMTLVEADTNTAFVSSPTLGPISSGITPNLSRSSTTLLPPRGSPPMNDLPLSPRTPERTSFDRLQLGRSSPTNSDATTSYPATPCDSLKGSFTLSPIDSLDMTRRSSSPSCPDSQLSPKTSSNNLRSFNRSFRINDSVNSLTPFRLGQQLSPATTLHAAGRNPALPHQPSSPAWDTYRLGADIASSSLSSRSAPRSGSLPLPPTIHIPATMRHHSYATQSSSESIRELPITPTSNTIIHLVSPSSAFSVTMDTMSISSGSTGTSSKQVLRMEKKAIQAADKAAKKAEGQAKFEALRSEQMRKMAISRAEAQRQAEVAAKAAPVAKPAPKSKFGKFGTKFADAVLFPSGGEKSTMF